MTFLIVGKEILSYTSRESEGFLKASTLKKSSLMVVMGIEKGTKSIDRLISINCRDCFLFDGLNQFNFHEGVNTIVGSNGR